MAKVIRCGEIWLVDFNPSVGHEFQKQRPAVVIQSDRIIKISSLVTIMPVTSTLRNQMTVDLPVKKSSSNNLHHDSIVKVCSLTSFDKSRFIKKIGAMDPSVMVEIGEYLNQHFGAK